jgi:hypothetical protein
MDSQSWLNCVLFKHVFDCAKCFFSAIAALLNAILPVHERDLLSIGYLPLPNGEPWG